MNEMKGIHYVTDDQNRKIAVQIDLRKYGEQWQSLWREDVGGYSCAERASLQWPRTEGSADSQK